MTRDHYLAASVAILLVALAGCGSDSSSSNTQATSSPATSAPATTTTQQTTSSAPEVTHEEFVAKLNRICRTGNRVIDRANDGFQDAANAGNFAKAADILSGAVERTSSYLDQIEELDVPAEDQAAFDRYLRQTERVNAYSKRLVPAVRSGDLDEIQRLGNLSDRARDRRTDAAIDLGADDCGT